jgi:hypothetical protein
VFRLQLTVILRFFYIGVSRAETAVNISFRTYPVGDIHPYTVFIQFLLLPFFLACIFVLAHVDLCLPPPRIPFVLHITRRISSFFTCFSFPWSSVCQVIWFTHQIRKTLPSVRLSVPRRECGCQEEIEEKTLLRTLVIFQSRSDFLFFVLRRPLLGVSGGNSHSPETLRNRTRLVAAADKGKHKGEVVR